MEMHHPSGEPESWDAGPGPRNTSTPVAVRASDLIEGRLSVRQIEQRVTAQPSVTLDLITIRGMDETAEGAAELANAVAQAYQDQDAAPVLVAPLLGEIPDFATVGITDRVPTQSAPKSVAAEAYQFDVASLQSALQISGGSRILLTSASPGDGKTTSAGASAERPARRPRRRTTR